MYAMVAACNLHECMPPAQSNVPNQLVTASYQSPFKGLALTWGISYCKVAYGVMSWVHPGAFCFIERTSTSRNGVHRGESVAASQPFKRNLQPRCMQWHYFVKSKPWSIDWSIDPIDYRSNVLFCCTVLFLLLPCSEELCRRFALVS